MNRSIPLLQLNNGIDMPALGFGTFAKEGVPRKCFNAVIAALDTGYRHLDCASYYQNEDEVGAALRQWLNDNPDFKRSDIFITTKVWPQNLEPVDVEWSLNDSLRNLGLDYVDAFLIHWPFAVERTEDHKVKLTSDNKYILKHTLIADLSPTWRKMEELYLAGKARSIGVSNYRISDLQTLLTYAKIPPAINQIELHPFLPSPSLVTYCRAHNILPVAYSPLGSQHQCPSIGEKVLENKVIHSIAQEKNVDVAQVLVSWGLSKGWGVLPKSGDGNRIKQNFQIVDLNANEIERIDAISANWGEGKRFVNPTNTFGFDFFAGEERPKV